MMIMMMMMMMLMMMMMMIMMLIVLVLVAMALLMRMVMMQMVLVASMMMKMVHRYPPFHGFGAHTYNWDCGSAFYDTSVQILSVQQDAILRKVFWLLFGSIQWIYNTTSLVTTSHSHRILTKVL